MTSSKKIKARGSSKRNLATKSGSEPQSTLVSCDDVIDELKELFDALGIQSSPAIRRKSRLKRTISSKTLGPHPATVLANLLTMWNQDPEYLDGWGNPVPIRLRGTKRSFASLVRRCAPNIHPNKMLADLKRLRAIRIDKAGLIYPQSRSISIFVDRKLAAEHTLATLHGFIGTLRHNLGGESTNSNQLFHRIAWNHQFDSSKLPRFKIWLKNHGQHFLELADNWMARNSRRTTSAKLGAEKCVQVTVGIYLAKHSNLNMS